MNLNASLIVHRLRAALSARLYFLGAMGTAAVLTLARGFILAVILDVEGFGIYAIVASVGLFASNVLSFGRIEGFMKSFPRLWLAGQRRSVVASADRALLDVSLRGRFETLPRPASMVHPGRPNPRKSGIMSLRSDHPR
ncbi:hypothetical protein VSX64_23760, partial [Aurantimonas sp. C2-6-R+9]|uniref:hypothetical protein n=1 Tax=Aurantimonas sp. C2-6-R+9 TaxID=3114365 RepID=UPI002E180478|nr:hypothetical protein [Aurantimonas sp. C2-6-R+9]